MSVCFGVKWRCVRISVRTAVRRSLLIRSGMTMCLYLAVRVGNGEVLRS